MILLQRLLELRASHRIKIALPPGGAKIGMPHSDGFELSVIVPEMNDQLVESRLERLQHLT